MADITTEDFKQAVASKISVPLLAYFNARLEKVKTELVSTMDERAIRIAQGRAAELTETIRLIKSVRE